MDTATSMLIALAITLGLSGLMAIALGPASYAIVFNPASSVARARFWRAYVCAVIVILPLAALLLGLPDRVRSRASYVVLEVASITTGPIAVLAGVVILVGLVVAALPAASAIVVPVSREQADDLSRLLAKIDVIRAREILRQDQEELEHDSPQTDEAFRDAIS
jgi:hypothetical protein